MKEMASIAAVFTAYTASFVNESRGILATLWKRIQKENSELYVAADGLAA
jgi:hypothetical protein